MHSPIRDDGERNQKFNLQNSSEFIGDKEKVKIKTHSIHYKPLAEAYIALKSDKEVEVKLEKGEIYFIPLNNSLSKGIIFYPGCGIDPIAYAPFAKALAKEGIHVFVIALDLKSVLTNSARKLLENNSQINTWFAAGHSLGGSFASKTARDNNDKIKGLIMLASFPSVSLKNKDIKILHMKGSKDRVMFNSTSDVAYRLTADEKYLEKHIIAGGNHSYFGYYGQQLFDGIADIKREAQQQETIKKIIQFTLKNTI